MAIVKRLIKGSALTHVELDGNFTDLDSRANANAIADTAQNVVSAAIRTDLDVIRGVPVTTPRSVFLYDGVGSGAAVRIAGYGSYADSAVTSGTGQSFATGAAFAPMTINGGLSVVESLPSDATQPFWNTASNLIRPIGQQDTYTVRLSFTVSGYAGTSPYIDVCLDVGGAIGEIWCNTMPLLKSGADQNISVVIPFFTGSTFIVNGGTIKVRYAGGSGTVSIFKKTIFINRESKGS
jgi:hypothetical protein